MTLESHSNRIKWTTLGVTMVAECIFIYLVKTYSKNPAVNLRWQFISLMALSVATLVWMIIRRVSSRFLFRHTSADFSTSPTRPVFGGWLGAIAKMVISLCLAVAVFLVVILVTTDSTRTIHYLMPNNNTNNPRDLFKCGRWGEPEEKVCQLDGSAVFLMFVVGILLTSDSVMTFISDRRALRPAMHRLDNFEGHAMLNYK
ncbi:hypothetical protein BG004_008468 [Podila humilis]|nr:hypothetical protein BG004_008468 [Podila humilis]